MKHLEHEQYNIGRNKELAPQESECIGVVVVIHTIRDGKLLIGITQENMQKKQFDKEIGDYTPPAETRNTGETLEACIERGLREETGLTGVDARVGTMPIGYYYFDGASPGDKVWIKAVSAFVDWQAVGARPLGPEDGESKGLYWVDPNVFLADMPVRGAMLGIVSDWLSGRRNVVAKTTPGRHIRNNI